jgi:HNH endonuclease
MAIRTGWTRQQLLVAFKLYCQLPFGKLHSRNPEIIKHAEAIGRTPSALAMKLTNIASLDPAIISTGRKGLKGASAADREMWVEMESDWEAFAFEIKQAYSDLALEPEEGHNSEGNYTGFDRQSQTTVRVGQDFFRQSVLSAYRNRCCITGLAVPKLLVASHIVPWRVDQANRLNPRNGLCLSMLHDKAFDAGMITIAEDMTVKVSRKYVMKGDTFFSSAILAYEGQQIEIPEKFVPDHDYLSYHRDVVFEQG